MTFIASVVAKKGVAVIADSLVTSMGRFLELGKFMNLIKERELAANGGPLSLDPKEVEALFERRPSFTKDYEEKLFRFDDFTAITTAGAAYINEKQIEELLNNDILPPIQVQPLSGSPPITIDKKLSEFCERLDQEVRAHINKFQWIDVTTFIITSFNKDTNTTRIFQVRVGTTTIDKLADPNYQTVTMTEFPQWQKVVCDGQNRLSDKLLYGGIDAVDNVLQGVVDQVIDDFKIPREDVPTDYVEKMSTSPTVMTSSVLADMKIFGLKNLSLQQAVDLACLLMSIEVNFQKFTENIPTVGGVVKLAVIDKGGFKLLKGADITVPHHF